MISLWKPVAGVIRPVIDAWNVYIKGNLEVDGTVTLDGGVTLDGAVIVEETSTEALLVRKEADGGDLIAFNTTSNIILHTGDHNAGNAAGPAILNEAASSTNPTLIPNKADLTTGIGWSTAAIEVVVSGVEELKIDASAVTIPSNNLICFGTISTKTGATTKIEISPDGVINWGNSADYGRLTWDGNDAILQGQSGKTLLLSANNLSVIRITGSTTNTESFLPASLSIGGSLNRKAATANSGALAGASGSIAVNVPSGARIIGCSLRVDTLVVINAGVGDQTWDAVYATGATQVIAEAAAAAANTKVDKFFDPNAATPIASAVTTITVTPNAGAVVFTSGQITAVVYYETLTSLASL